MFKDFRKSLIIVSNTYPSFLFFVVFNLKQSIFSDSRIPDNNDKMYLCFNILIIASVTDCLHHKYI